MAVKQFPFNWKKHFVKEDDSEDCIPACLAMAGRYWKHQDSSLAIPADVAGWSNFLNSLHVHSHRGTNLIMLKSALKKVKGKGIGLSIRMIQPKKLADLTKLFEFIPPIPVILCYDRSMTINNIEGPNHASLLYSIDLLREQVRVVDPSQVYRDTPMSYTQEDFIKGWNAVNNLTLLVYPSNIRVLINTRIRDSTQTLDQWRNK